MSDAATGWSDDRVELLAKLWAEGLSASQIAGVLGGGVTRNAVIGKVHRLGLSGRAKAGAPAAQRTPKVRPASSPTPEALQPTQRGTDVLQRAAEAPEEAWIDDAAIPVSQRVTILELRDSMCRWPIGDPSKPDFAFCGGKAVTGLPYCGHHCRVAYQPAAERRRLRA